MLRFFHSSRIFTALVITLIGAATWLHALMGISEVMEIRHGTVYFERLLSWVGSWSVWCGYALTMISAFTLFALNRWRLIDKMTMLPALCYVLLIGGIPVSHQLTPEGLAMPLMAIAFSQVMSSFRSERLSYGYFSAAVCIALATLFYAYAYMFLAVLWFCLLMFRPGYGREWFFTILGFLFPFFWVFGWHFLVDDDPAFLLHFVDDMFSFHAEMHAFMPSTLVFIGMGTLFGLIAFVYLLRHVVYRKIIVRNGHYTLIFVTLIVILTAVVVPDTLPLIWYLLAFPLSFFLAYYLDGIKARRANLALFLLFMAVGIAQWVYLHG